MDNFTKTSNTEEPVLLYVFTCHCESTEFATANGQANGAKICKIHGNPMVMHKKLCPDCGEWFYCSKMAQKKIRCTSCHKAHHKSQDQSRKVAERKAIFNCSEEDFFATFEEIGKFFSISKERARNIQNAAARKFKAEFTRRYGEFKKAPKGPIAKNIERLEFFAQSSIVDENIFRG